MKLGEPGTHENRSGESAINGKREIRDHKGVGGQSGSFIGKRRREKAKKSLQGGKTNMDMRTFSGGGGGEKLKNQKIIEFKGFKA